MKNKKIKSTIITISILLAMQLTGCGDKAKNPKDSSNKDLVATEDVNLSDENLTITQEKNTEGGFVSWEDAGLEDHVMDWKDERLEQAMHKQFHDGDIMLSEVWEMEKLSLSHMKIKDISALSELKNLTWLELDSNEISDLTPLSELKNLTLLDLDNNEISDLTPLSELENLTQLALNDNEISNISALGNLTKLYKLYLKYNNISDYSPVEFVENLTK